MTSAGRAPEIHAYLAHTDDEHGELYYMTDEMIFQLYYQNPKLGFYFMRLVAGRLLRDLSRSEGRPAAD